MVPSTTKLVAKVHQREARSRSASDSQSRPALLPVASRSPGGNEDGVGRCQGSGQGSGGGANADRKCPSIRAFRLERHQEGDGAVAIDERSTEAPRNRDGNRSRAALDLHVRDAGLAIRGSDDSLSVRCCNDSVPSEPRVAKTGAPEQHQPQTPDAEDQETVLNGAESDAGQSETQQKAIA